MRTKCLFVIVQIIIFILRLDIDTSKKLKGNSQKINYVVYFTFIYAAFFTGEKIHTKCFTVKTSVKENTEDKSIKQNTYIMHPQTG